MALRCLVRVLFWPSGSSTNYAFAVLYLSVCPIAIRLLIVVYFSCKLLNIITIDCIHLRFN